MNTTPLDYQNALLATLSFTTFMLVPGTLLLLATRTFFGIRSRAERLLWSTSLSLPLSLVLTAVAARPSRSNLIPPLVLLLAIITIATWILLTLRAQAQPIRLLAPLDRSTTAALLAMAFLLCYILIATSALQIGHHLFESVNASDWSVRIPLVAASIRNGVPPGNPFFTFNAQPQPARFYFYWYSLVAAVCRLAHLPARAGLAASVVWSAFSLIAMLFLALKHLAPPAAPLRRQCLLALFLCCIMGIDILPAIAGLLTHPVHLYPEIEWWHADRIPSFLGAIIFAPHHIAGMVCCLVAFLALVHSPFRRPAQLSSSWRSTLLNALVAGICFAAAAGTSTYIAFCFGFVGLLYGLDLLRQRRLRDLSALLLATTLALLLSLPFLHELLSSPALPAAAGQHTGHFFRLALRELGDGDRFVIAITKRLHHRVTFRPLMHLLALPFVAVSLPLEFGFFLVPLGIRFTRDLRRLRAHTPFSDGERLLWIIFLGAAIPALFLSSDPTQGVNDLGRHAGLILRFVAIVWSTPICWKFLERLRAHQPLAPKHPWATRFALVLLLLGLATQLWQIVMDRSFLILVHYTHRNPEMPFAKDDNLGGRYFDLRHGLAAVESHLPPNAVVQSNPGSRYQMIVMLYSDHPFAAADTSCEAAFGGDLRLCQPIVAQLQRLFGGPSDVQPAPLGPYITVTAPDAAETTTPAAFLAACRDLHLAALVAQNSDPAWSLPNSWVWHEQPAFATPIVRIIPCPTASPADRPLS